MKKFILLISMFCLTNQFSINASEICGLSNQDDGKGKTEAEHDASVEMDKSVNMLEKQASIQQDKKAQDEKDKIEFEYLHWRYQKEVDAVVGALQISQCSVPTDIEKLIVGYCESPDYVLHQILIENDKSLKAIKLKNGDLAISCGTSAKIWRSNSDGYWQVIQTLFELKGSVTGIRELPNGDLISFSEEDSVRSVGQVVKIWRFNNDAEVWECVNEFTPRSDFAYFFKLLNNSIALGTYDTLKICNQNIDGSWDIQDFQDFFEHDDNITHAIQLDNGDIVCSSADPSISIWRRYPFELFKQWKCIQILDKDSDNFHKAAVNFVIKLDNGNLTSCSRDKTIKIWNNCTGTEWKCVATLRGNIKQVSSVIQLQDGKLASCSDDGTVLIWQQHGKSYRWIETINESNVHSILELNNGDLLLCSKDKVKIYRRPFNNLFAKPDAPLAKDSPSSQSIPTIDDSQSSDLQNEKHDNFVSNLVKYIKDNPIKTSAAIATLGLIAKYRQTIWNIFRK